MGRRFVSSLQLPLQVLFVLLLQLVACAFVYAQQQQPPQQNGVADPPADGVAGPEEVMYVK